MVDVDDRSLQENSKFKSVTGESHLMLFYVYQMNQVNSHDQFHHHDSTINIVLDTIIILPLYNPLGNLNSGCSPESKAH